MSAKHIRDVVVCVAVPSLHGDNSILKYRITSPAELSAERRRRALEIKTTRVRIYNAGDLGRAAWFVTMTEFDIVAAGE